MSGHRRKCVSVYEKISPERLSWTGKWNLSLPQCLISHFSLPLSCFASTQFHICSRRSLTWRAPPDAGLATVKRRHKRPKATESGQREVEPQPVRPRPPPHQDYLKCSRSPFSGVHLPPPPPPPPADLQSRLKNNGSHYWPWLRDAP